MKVGLQLIMRRRHPYAVRFAIVSDIVEKWLRRLLLIALILFILSQILLHWGVLTTQVEQLEGVPLHQEKQ